jgi:hypothetical protein
VTRKRPKNPPEYVVVNGANRKCSADGCQNVITHFAYKKGDFDGRVFCARHGRQAER